MNTLLAVLLNSRFSYWPFEGLLIFILIVFNCFLVLSDNRFRHLEILHRAKYIVKQVEGNVMAMKFIILRKKYLAYNKLRL